MTLEQGDRRLLDTDLAKRLLMSTIPARCAYAALDGTPRIVPSWYVDGRKARPADVDLGAARQPRGLSGTRAEDPGRITRMSKVVSAHAVSVDGYITGRDPGPGRGLGDGSMLFDWYTDGDTGSPLFDGFMLSEPSARVFDELAERVGAVVAGRNTYEDSEHFGGDGPHPTARLFVLSHRPAPEMTERQTLVTTGIEAAVAAAREAAGDKDVGLMGGGVVTAALQLGLVDEVILHQVPVLLGGGRRFFQALPDHVRLHLVEAVVAPGVTHLHYAVVR
jgi:dihydrofolate reductase